MPMSGLRRSKEMTKLFKGLKMGFIVPFYGLTNKNEKFSKRILDMLILIVMWPYVFYLAIKDAFKSR